MENFEQIKFTEAKLEQSFIERLTREHYTHALDKTIKRQPDKVLTEEDLQNFLLLQYKIEGITLTEVRFIFLQLKFEQVENLRRKLFPNVFLL